MSKHTPGAEEYMRASDQLSLVTGALQGPHGDFLPGTLC